MIPPSTPTIRASEICDACCFTLEEVQAGGRNPELVATRWEIISTMRREGYRVVDIAPLVGLKVRTCRDYLRGKVHASRDVQVRDVILDSELKKVRRSDN